MTTQERFQKLIQDLTKQLGMPPGPKDVKLCQYVFNAGVAAGREEEAAKRKPKKAQKKKAGPNPPGACL